MSENKNAMGEVDFGKAFDAISGLTDDQARASLSDPVVARAAMLSVLALLRAAAIGFGTHQEKVGDNALGVLTLAAKHSGSPELVDAVVGRSVNAVLTDYAAVNAAVGVVINWSSRRKGMVTLTPQQFAAIVSLALAGAPAVAGGDHEVAHKAMAVIIDAIRQADAALAASVKFAAALANSSSAS